VPASPAAVPAEPEKVGVVSLVALPSAGAVSVTAGRERSIVQLCVAGVPSTLPAASTARTANVCAPGARLE